MTWPTFIPEGGLLDNRRLQGATVRPTHYESEDSDVL